MGFNRTSTSITCWSKHGQTTLTISGHDPPMKTTVFMDISINPNPILHKIPVRTTVNRWFCNRRRRSFGNNSIRIRSRSMNNLIKVPMCKNTSVHNTGEVGCLKFSTLNARSIRDKTLIIKDFVVDYDVDIAAITETWLRYNDDLIIRELRPTGYKLVHNPRISDTGAGVGFLYKENIGIEHVTYHGEFRSFGCLDVTFVSLNHIRSLVIYRPPCSTVNGLSVNLFLDEFSSLLEEVVISTSEFLLLGDFNFHIDDKDDIHTKQFMDTIESFNCKQLVTQAMHVCGHILYLVIVRDDLEDSYLNDLCVADHSISDHSVINFCLNLTRPPRQKKDIVCRKIKRIDFNSDINESNLMSDMSDLSSLVNNYEHVLGSLLDKDAPMKQRTITFRPKAPCYNANITEAKRLRRQLERK